MRDEMRCDLEKPAKKNKKKALEDEIAKKCSEVQAEHREIMLLLCV
jgi:hypothetical protein